MLNCYFVALLACILFGSYEHPSSLFYCHIRIHARVRCLRAVKELVICFLARRRVSGNYAADRKLCSVTPPQSIACQPRHSLLHCATPLLERRHCVPHPSHFVNSVMWTNEPCERKEGQRVHKCTVVSWFRALRFVHGNKICIA